MMTGVMHPFRGANPPRNNDNTSDRIDPSSTTSTPRPTHLHRASNHRSPMIPSSTPSIRNSDDFIGDRMSAHKPSNTTRLYFANVNGLSYGPQGGDLADVCSTMATSHIDLLGLVETKLDSRLPQVVATCKRAARAVFSFSRVVLSSSAISYGTPYKPGGTALLAAGNITGRITHTHQDHMGRWSAISFLGAQTCKLTVICAYQVCKASSRNNRTHPNPST